MKINLFNLLLSFIKNPQKAWSDNKAQTHSTKDIFIKYLLPLVIIGACIKLLGRFISLNDFSIINSILIFLAFCFISISIIYLSSWIINKLLPKFKTSEDFLIIFKIISFSAFPAILGNALSDLHPVLSFLNFASAYSLILFWIGTVNCLKIPKEHTTGFVLISFIIIAMASLLLSFLTMTVFLSIFFNL